MEHKDYNIINLEYKGTKGPWCMGEYSDGLSGIWKDEELKDGLPILVARTCYLPLSIENAKLISAAPDLLEACDDLLQYWLGTYGESYVTEAAQAAISKAVGKPYAEIEQAKKDCINETISNFDLLNNKLQHACNLMNQMYDSLSEVGVGMVDLTDVEEFLRENDKTQKPEKESDPDLELPF